MRRPVIPLPLSKTDKLAETIGWLIIILHWGYVTWQYTGLPEIIPIHFNASGEADGFGSKRSLMGLPAINAVLFIGMTILNRFPQAFNYLEEITPENAERQYRAATRMIRYVKLITAVLFFLITYSTVETANSGSSSLSPWMLPIVGLLILGILIASIWMAIKQQKDA